MSTRVRGMRSWRTVADSGPGSDGMALSMRGMARVASAPPSSTSSPSAATGPSMVGMPRSRTACPLLERAGAPTGAPHLGQEWASGGTKAPQVGTPCDLGHGNPLRKTKVIVARRAGDGTRRHLRTTVWTPHANPSRLSLTQQSESSRTFSPFRPPRTIPSSKLSQGL
jgi:hypothetical protein